MCHQITTITIALDFECVVANDIYLDSLFH